MHAYGYIARSLFVGLICAALAMALRFTLDPVLGSSLGYAFALGGVALSLFLAHWYAGIVSACASAAWVNYFYVIPRFEYADVVNVPFLGALVTYAGIAAVLIFFGARASLALAQEKRAKEEAQRALDAADRANEAWQRADRQKDEFISVLSHELRNPLGAISNATHVIRERSRNRDLRPAVELLYRQLQQMRLLLDDLLDVARINRGLMTVHRVPADLRLCVQNAIDANMHLVEEAGQVLEVVLPDGPVMLSVDSARITQIVSNLLNNGAKYAGRGARIEARIDPTATGARITVRDDGAGIEPELLKQLFTRFAEIGRGDGAAARRRIQGLGLGLWISQSIAQLHGGTITAASGGAGRGCEFTVDLPCAVPEETTVEG